MTITSFDQSKSIYPPNFDWWKRERKRGFSFYSFPSEGLEAIVYLNFSMKKRKSLVIIMGILYAARVVFWPRGTEDKSCYFARYILQVSCLSFFLLIYLSLFYYYFFFLLAGKLFVIIVVPLLNSSVSVQCLQSKI